MGYLQDFTKRLDELLLTCAIGEESRLKIKARAASAVLESYKNGLTQGRAEKGGPRNAKPPRRTARRTR